MSGPASVTTLADGQPIAVSTLRAVEPDAPGPQHVVCVPGGPARAGAYLGNLGGLDRRRTLHVLDNRGSGGSRPADPATVAVGQMARDLLELVRLLGLDRPVLLGHSFGIRVVAAALELAPDLAGAVIFVTPGPLVVDPSTIARSRDAILDVRAHDPEYAEAVEAGRAIPTARPRDTAMLMEASTPLWYGSWGPDQQAHAAAGRSQVDVRTAMALRNDSAGWLPPDVSAVTVPVLVVAGSLDFLAPPPVAHAVHELFADSTYVEIEGAGHFPWLDEPAAFAGVVDDFLAEHG